MTTTEVAQLKAEEKLYEAARALSVAASHIRDMQDIRHDFASLASVVADNLATMTENLYNRIRYRQDKLA